MMTRQKRIQRRQFVAGTIGTALALSVAGCLGDDDEVEVGERVDELYDGDPDWNDFVTTANGYEEVGGTADFTGENSVSVVCGGGPEGMTYEPAAIAIDSGTTVVWEWAGVGGAHDVVEGRPTDADHLFESDLVAEEGFTFEYTFDDPGTYEYHCTPHESMGKRGGVYVVE